MLKRLGNIFLGLVMLAGIVTFAVSLFSYLFGGGPVSIVLMVIGAMVTIAIYIIDRKKPSDSANLS